MSSQNKNAAFQMIADIDGDFSALLGNQTPENAPILPVRNLVLFPGVVTPILIGRESSKALVKKAEKKGTVICVIPQRDPDVEVPMKDDLYEYGVYAKVMKLLTLPNGNITTIVQGLGRARLCDIISTQPYLEGVVEPVEEIEPEKRDREFKTAMDDLRDLAATIEQQDKVVMMGDYIRQYPNYDHVPDPYYEGSEGFELVLDLLEDACENLLDRILKHNNI